MQNGGIERSLLGMLASFFLIKSQPTALASCVIKTAIFLGFRLSASYLSHINCFFQSWAGFAGQLSRQIPWEAATICKRSDCHTCREAGPESHRSYF